MSRALPIALAVVLAYAAFAQIQAAYAYDSVGIVHQPSGAEGVLLAYVDPGAAGFIIVSVLGFISAVGYTARAYIGRLKRLVPWARKDERGVDERR